MGEKRKWRRKEGVCVCVCVGGGGGREAILSVIHGLHDISHTHTHTFHYVGPLYNGYHGNHTQQGGNKNRQSASASLPTTSASLSSHNFNISST